MGGRRRRERVEPTEEWEQLALLCRWPAQLAYEEIRPLTLFGGSVAERARETGTAERTLYRRVGRFEEEGVESLFGSGAARRKRLPSDPPTCDVVALRSHPRGPQRPFMHDPGCERRRINLPRTPMDKG
jgi:Helix-turn-helix domain